MHVRRDLLQVSFISRRYSSTFDDSIMSSPLGVTGQLSGRIQRLARPGGSPPSQNMLCLYRTAPSLWHIAWVAAARRTLYLPAWNTQTSSAAAITILALVSGFGFQQGAICNIVFDPSLQSLLCTCVQKLTRITMEEVKKDTWIWQICMTWSTLLKKSRRSMHVGQI